MGNFKQKFWLQIPWSKTKAYRQTVTSEDTINATCQKTVGNIACSVACGKSVVHAILMRNFREPYV